MRIGVKALAIVLLALVLWVQPAFAQNKLGLYVDSSSACFKPGDNITIRMYVSELLQKVNACQAFLGYNSTYLAAPHQIVPGGGPWEEMIYESFNDVSGELDTAIGIKLESPIMGTDADGTVAIINFTAGAEGVTKLVFREDQNSDFATMFSDLDAQPVYPTKIDSPSIYIDGTSPKVEILSVSQNGVDLLPGNPNAVQGIVDITVKASDSISGINGHPVVMVTPMGGSPEQAVFTSIYPPGVFHYQYRVTSKTPNKLARIDVTAFDNSGNAGVALQKSFNINKNQGSVTVELDGLNPRIPVTRNVTFVFTNYQNTVIETRNVPVMFSTHSSTATVTLADINPASKHLSAKTAWNLRKKLDVLFDVDGQFVINFTGSSKLPGGDLNQDNVIMSADYSLLKYYWYTTNSVADVNADGVVQAADYGIMKNNWYTKGDAQ